MQKLKTAIHCLQAKLTDSIFIVRSTANEGNFNFPSGHCEVQPSGRLLMYIAIVADNIADRKQLERLMARTNDSMKNLIGDLYIDSYGNVDAALTAPMKYGLFILDFTLNPNDALLLIQGLKDTNAPAVISVCRPDGAPLAIESQVSDLWHINKPVSQSELNELALKANAYIGVNTTVKIEIRGKEKTYYEEPDSILYAEEGEIANYVYLKNGTCIRYYGEFEDLLNNILLDERFVLFKKDTIVNKNHIREITKHSVILDNDMEFSLPIFAKNPLLG